MELYSRAFFLYRPMANEATRPLFSLVPIVPDAGATRLLLRQSSLPSLRHLFRPKALPSLAFSLPGGGLLPVDGSTAEVLHFLKESETAECYIVPDSSLAHNLFGTSPLI
jgi:hypothetical protein